MTKKLLKKTSLFFHDLSNWLHRWFKNIRKRILPESLLYRFILIILVPLLFLQAAILVVFFDRHWDTVSRRLARDVSGEIGAVAHLIQENDMALPAVGLVIDALNKKLLLDIYFEANAKISPRKNHSNDSTIRILVSELQNLGYPFVIQDNGHHPSTLSIQLDRGVLHSSIPRKRFFSSTVYVFLIWMFGFSILLFWIAFLFMKNQVRAIVRLSKAAESFGRGQRVISFKPEGATEVRHAGISFIQMRNRIQRYLTERTGMLSGVSHDLKTPLTRMKLQLSMMPQTDSTYDLQKDVSEMEHMLEAYLSFARGEGKEQFEATSLNSLLEDLIARLTKAGQKLDYHATSSVTCQCRPSEISRAVMNLLTNAGRYAKKAKVTLDTSHDMARITIDDNGPGIPANKRADVFRAFYRIEPSRNKKTGGIGLGLTIARDIILSHGGELILSDSPMGGLRAIVTLPLADNNQEGDLS